MTDHATAKNPSFLFKIGDHWELQRAVFEAGVTPALYDALELARDSGNPPPDWAVEGALKIVGDRLKHGFTIGKGVTGNELAKYHYAMKRFRQWEAIKKLRKEGVKWTEIYAVAEKRLANTFAEAKEDTIEKSYKRVEQELKDPEKALQYYRANREVQELTDTPVLDLG